ncbi:MAG: hypothetical protein IJS90_03075 [Clostridia bacterium]|nr:hypothetical protein [Clostridia bacterium]
MKKVISVQIVFIFLLMLCACSSPDSGKTGAHSSKKEPLNAANFSQLADSEGFVYGFSIMFDIFAFKFYDETHLSWCDIILPDVSSRSDLTEDNITLDYEDLNEAFLDYTAYGEDTWSMKRGLKYWTFYFVYADPENEYVIFQSSAGPDFDFNDAIILMNKQLFVSMYRNEPNDFFTSSEDYNNLDTWIEYLDFCKA